MQINNFLVNNKNIIFFGELRFDEKIVFGKIGFYDFRSDPELDPDQLSHSPAYTSPSVQRTLLLSPAYTSLQSSVHFSPVQRTLLHNTHLLKPVPS